MVSDAKPALQSSGLNCSVNCGVISKVDAIIREPDCDFGRALEEVRKAVRNAKHAFYKGSFYVMSAGGKCNFDLFAYKNPIFRPLSMLNSLVAA